jgi:sulfatase modifying factor 1
MYRVSQKGEGSDDTDSIEDAREIRRGPTAAHRPTRFSPGDGASSLPMPARMAYVDHPPALAGKIRIARAFSRWEEISQTEGLPMRGRLVGGSGLAVVLAALAGAPGFSQEPGKTTTNSIGMKLALIPAGTFPMGSPDDDKGADADEKPQHEVRISAFYLGVTEVTRGQFRRFVDDTGYKTEAEKDGKGGYGWNEEKKTFEQDPKYTWLTPGFEQTEDHPVVNVSWNDAVAFCAWLSRADGQTYRLPTEAEWEYACRARTTTKYFSGDDPESLAAVGNVADGTAKAKYPNWTTIAARDGFIYTAPVGQYRPNGFGLYDMHGNVWEWCQDEYDAEYYKRSPGVDPPGPSGESVRVIRGGGWGIDPRVCRSAVRDWRAPGYRLISLGFRVARVQSPR